VLLDWAHTTSRKDVLEADVERRVCVRSEGISILAIDILGLAVFIAHSIANLVAQHQPLHLIQAPYSSRMLGIGHSIHACSMSVHPLCIH
jgi:hypothetical protein